MLIIVPARIRNVQTTMLPPGCRETDRVRVPSRRDSGPRTGRDRPHARRVRGDPAGRSGRVVPGAGRGADDRFAPDLRPYPGGRPPQGRRGAGPRQDPQDRRWNHPHGTAAFPPLRVSTVPSPKRCGRRGGEDGADRCGCPPLPPHAAKDGMQECPESKSRIEPSTNKEKTS